MFAENRFNYLLRRKSGLKLFNAMSQDMHDTLQVFAYMVDVNLIGDDVRTVVRDVDVLFKHL